MVQIKLKRYYYDQGAVVVFWGYLIVKSNRINEQDLVASRLSVECKALA